MNVYSEMEMEKLGFKLGLVLSSMLRDPMTLISLVNKTYEQLPPQEREEALKSFKKAIHALLKELAEEVKS